MTPRWVPANSRSSSSLGSSITGLGGCRPPCGAVKLDVAPWWGPCSCMGELSISSRDGIGRLVALQVSKVQSDDDQITSLAGEFGQML